MTVMMTARKPGEKGGGGTRGLVKGGGVGAAGRGVGVGVGYAGDSRDWLCVALGWRGWEVGRIFDEDASRVISEKLLLYGLYSVK